MRISHYRETAPDPAGEVDAEGVSVRWVIAERDGAENFSMRVITVDPGGHTPFHEHPWEHEVFILAGEGKVIQRDSDARCSSGDVVFILPGELHQFANPSDEALEFVCLIPNPS